MKRVMMWLGLVIVVALIYDGWIFYSRRSGNREAAREQADKVLSQERRTIDAYGGGGLKILSFYASPGVIARGGQTSLCYSVTGSKTVRMEPAVGEVWPALSRCVPVSPRKDTEYKFIAEDGAGHSVTQSVVVKLRP
jgi:hypothetical protein